MEEIFKAVEKNERFLGKYLSVNFLNKENENSQSRFKVAIQLSGGLRNFEHTVAWINKFLVQPLNADVFFYGWANNQGVEDNKKIITQYHNLKLFQINDLNDQSFDFLKEKDRLKYVIKSQFYNIFECNELRKKFENDNNFNYDIIIRARPDAFFFNEIKEDILNEIFISNSIFVPNNYFCYHYSPYTTDCFAIGKREYMDSYCQAYKYFSAFQSRLNSSSAAEFFIHSHLNTNMRNITIRNIDVNFTLEYPYDFIDMEKIMYQNDSSDDYKDLNRYQVKKTGKEWSGY